MYTWDVDDLGAFIDCCKSVNEEAKNPNARVFTGDNLDEWR